MLCSQEYFLFYILKLMNGVFSNLIKFEDAYLRIVA